MSEGSAPRSDFWLGFVFGGVAGGFLTLLFTTEKGKKLREKISEEGGDWAGQVIDVLGQVVTNLEEKTEERKEEEGEKLTPKLKKPLEEIQAPKKEAETTKTPFRRRRFFKRGPKKASKKGKAG